MQPMPWRAIRFLARCRFCTQTENFVVQGRCERRIQPGRDWIVDAAATCSGQSCHLLLARIGTAAPGQRRWRRAARLGSIAGFMNWTMRPAGRSYGRRAPSQFSSTWISG